MGKIGKPQLLKDQNCNITSSVPSPYYPSLPISIHTDASELGIAAVLVQTKDNEKHPVAFTLRILIEAEIK